jgi:serine/threonine-protein kinase/endoribonuclease IRE1
LKDLAHGEYAVHAVGGWQKVLHQITSGLDHLHRKQVIHGHLKPKNILVSYPDCGVPPMIKLVNFGIAHRIISGDGNPVTLWKLGGSKGWLPAEAYVKTNFTTEMDVYALGLVFFYSLSKGCHPFGKDKEERVIRMKRSEHRVFTADQLKNSTDPEKVVQLINWMLSSEPSARPTTTQLFMDAFFSSTTAARDVASSELESSHYIFQYFFNSLLTNFLFDSSKNSEKYKERGD